MKSFRQHLLESTLSVADALEILGLPTKFTADELKAAYKKAALANHPDKGGDVESMKKVNAAHDKLKAIAGTKTGSSTVDPNWFERARDKDKQYVNTAFKKVLDAFKPQPFEKYFEQIFGEQFTTTVEKNENKGSFSAYSVLEAQWSNNTKTTVITLRLTISAAGRHSHTGNLGAENVDVAVGVFPEIYHNKRKIKLKQRTWDYKTDYRVLSNPEDLFPRAKLDAKKDATGGKFSKKDALLAFQRELGATTFDKDSFIKVPMPNVDGKEPHILFYRTTWQGYSTYGTNGIYVANRRVEGLAAMSLVENLPNITWFIDELKKIQRLTSIQAVKSAIGQVAQHARSQ